MMGTVSSSCKVESCETVEPNNVHNCLRICCGEQTCGHVLVAFVGRKMQRGEPISGHASSQ